MRSSATTPTTVLPLSSVTPHARVVSARCRDPASLARCPATAKGRLDPGGAPKRRKSIFEEPHLLEKQAVSAPDRVIVRRDGERFVGHHGHQQPPGAGSLPWAALNTIGNRHSLAKKPW